MLICTQKNWSCASIVKHWTWSQFSVLSLTGESEDVFRITWQPLLNADIECCGYSARRTLAWGWGGESPSSSCVAWKHVPTALKCLSVHSPEIIVTHLFVKFHSRTFAHMSSIIIFLFFSFFFITAVIKFTFYCFSNRLPSHSLSWDILWWETSGTFHKGITSM